MPSSPRGATDVAPVPSNEIPIVTDFWSSTNRHPPGHGAALNRWRELIVSTQQQCHRICNLTQAYHGGALSDARRLAYALMYAVNRNCALITDWPEYRGTENNAATMTTSPELRKRCAESGRRGIQCYFLPLSLCYKTNTLGPVKHFVLDKVFFLDEQLRRIQLRTGLTSEVLIMGQLLAWVMRPQPELREAITLYGTHLGFDAPGVRHRRVALHVRRGDKHSLYTKHMRNHSWRVSTESFDAWTRRVAADLGAEHTLYMTDSSLVMNGLAVSHGGDGFFQLAPSPRDCMPSIGAGALGKHHVPAANLQKKLHSAKLSAQVSNKASNASALCGPRYLIDDGIQLFAGVALLAQCHAFVGTQISNVDSAVVELQSALRFPPTYFDVLNDVHRACLSDERVWFGGVHAPINVRPLDADRLAKGDGNFTPGDC